MKQNVLHYPVLDPGIEKKKKKRSLYTTKKKKKKKSPDHVTQINGLKVLHLVEGELFKKQDNDLGRFLF